MRTPANKYKCPGALWRKFTNESKVIYNNVYQFGRQSIMMHPKAKLTREQYATIRHNFACAAAWAIRDMLK